MFMHTPAQMENRITSRSIGAGRYTDSRIGPFKNSKHMSASFSPTPLVLRRKAANSWPEATHCGALIPWMLSLIRFALR